MGIGSGVTMKAYLSPGSISPRMSCRTPSDRLPLARRTALTRLGAAAGFAACLLAGAPASAQLSLSSAVDLALRTSPRIKSAQDDVARARAQLSQVHDVYIPSLTAGAGLGESYGYSPNPPTLFTFQGGSLVYNQAQFSYIRSAHSGVSAAELSLTDMREVVAEDTALAFTALQHDQQREEVIDQQFQAATALVAIVQQRFDAGLDRAIDLTQVKLTAAQFRLASLHAHDDTANDRTHLARLVGLPEAGLRADIDFPDNPPALDTPEHEPANAAIASAFANAEAKRQQAKGDASFRYRPQVNLVVQYNRYATFTNSFKQLDNLNGGHSIGANEGVFAVQIILPLFDRFRQAKALETAAEASRALHEAQNAQFQVLDAETRLRHAIAETQARGDVAALEQQLAQQQLEILRLQMQEANPNGPQMTPRDEQNSRIAERDKYLGVVDAAFQFHQAEIQLLRQTGQLTSWLRLSAPASTPGSLPPAPAPHP